MDRHPRDPGAVLDAKNERPLQEARKKDNSEQHSRNRQTRAVAGLDGHQVDFFATHLDFGFLFAFFKHTQRCSGSGKTTLLNVINFKSKGNLNVKGDILINGIRADQIKMGQVSCFVRQDDLFFPNLTVKEHLMIQVRSVTVNEYFHHANDLQ